MSDDEFVNDFQALLAGDPQMDAMALQIAGNLRSLSDADVAVIMAQLPAKTAAMVRAGLDQLRKSGGAVTDEELWEVLRREWNAGGRELVKAELDRLTAPKVQA